MHLGLGSPKLCKILQPAPPRLPTCPDLQLELEPKSLRPPNPSLSRHTPGDIWKQVLLRSVFQDLLLGDSPKKVEVTSPCPVQAQVQRRFVRLESVGLSGLIWYEMGEKTLTLERVFGEPGHDRGGSQGGGGGGDGGMDLDDLLDVVKARVVYFPAFACTSFIAGQTMSAYLANRLDITPQHVQEGFSVPLVVDSPLITESAPSCLDLHSWAPILSSPDPDTPTLSFETTSSTLFPSTPYLDNLSNITDYLSLSNDDPYLSLCIRSSSLKLPRVKNDSFSDGEQSDTTLSIVDSPLVCTPWIGALLGGCSCFGVGVGLKSFLDFSDSLDDEDGGIEAEVDGGCGEGGLSSE